MYGLFQTSFGHPVSLTDLMFLFFIVPTVIVLEKMLLDEK